MTTNKNKKMFNIDEREKFKVRKSKKYKNLCSVAIGVLAISGLASAPASADELLSSSTPPVVIVTEELPTEEVIVYPAPSTNLTEVQPEDTVEATRTHGLVDTESGAISVTNESSELNQAVTAAQQEGIIVIEKPSTDYGVTQSVEETEKKQAEIAKDYENQATIINGVTAGYIAEKEKHSKATLAIIDFNNQLKEQYDAKIAEYNTDVLKVNAQNAAIDAAYDVARQAYEAEVLQIETYNADAKVKYEEAYQRYQAETQRILQLNEYKKQKYHTDLSEFNKEVVKVNEDNQKLESDYQAAYAAYEAELDRIKSTNASNEATYNQALETYRFEVERINRENEEKRKNFELQQGSATEAEAENKRLEAEYNTAYKAYEEALARVQSANQTSNQAYQDALTKYRSEVERINRENEAKRIAYEEARRTFDTTSSNIDAENQLIRQRNQQAQEAYNRAMEVYRTEKERHDRAVAEAQSSLTQEGHLSRLLVQNLKFSEESNAKVNIKGADYFAVDDSIGQDTSTAFTMFIEDYTGATSKIQPSSPINWVSSDTLPAYAAVLGARKTLEVTYTNLSNSSYNSTPISKVVYNLKNNNDKQATIYVMSDPTNGVVPYVKTERQSLSVEITFFDQQGNPISFSREDPAILALSSLNHYKDNNRQGWQHVEKITDYNFEFIPINGSTVTENRDGIYSINDNSTPTDGSKWTTDDWDQSDNPNFYYGAGAGIVTSGDSIRFTMVQENNTDSGHWLTISSKVAAIGGIIPAPPKEPTLKLEKEKTASETSPPEPVYEPLPQEPTPGGQTDIPQPPSKPNLIIPNRPQEPTYEALPKEPTVSYLDIPEAPTKPILKALPKEPTAPTYESLPIAPTVTYKETPRAPQKDPSLPLPEKPEEPTYKRLPDAPEVPTVSFRLATLKTQPQTEKAVETTEGINVDKGLVAKGQEIVFDLKVDPLPANRSLTTSGVFTDPLPKGFILNLENTVNAAAGYELSYSADNHVLSGVLTKETILSLNADLTKVASLPTFKVYGWVSNDAATYKNAWTMDFNGGEGKINGYTRTSNTVVVHTPGNPNDPDNPTNNEIKPTKLNTNASGVNINGKVVPVGSTNYYKITLDYDQYHAVVPDLAAIQSGFGGFDDYPEDALVVDLSKATAIDSDGKPVSGLRFENYASVSDSDVAMKELLEKSNVGSRISGAFVGFIAENPVDFYNTIIKSKKSVTITIPMIVKDNLYNTGKSFSNTAYQVDFGNGYVTNTVVNTTPRVKPNKTNTDSSGVVIDGKAVVANSVNYYKVTLDYSNYKGIDVDPNMIDKGFFLVDDFPEEAVVVENNGIKVETNSGEAVKGLTTTIYSSIAEAPKAVQESMAKRGFEPKGAIAVLAADEPQVFYETYVKTGLTLTATLPMTVKAEMAKTGGQYENTAYQIDFGSAYVTETVVNNVIPVGRVIVNYLEDGTGKVLDHPVIDEDDVLEGTDYDTTDRKRTEIVTKDGKTYDLVRHEGNETGKVVKGDTVITYFYKEVLGDVVVNYKDTNGKVIKESVTDTPLTSTGTAYDTKDNKPKTIVRPDGSSFRLVPAKTVGAEEGKIVRGRTEVTYVYEEILGSVSVGYTDKDGNVIKEPVVDTPTGSTGRDYDTTDNKPKEIVTKDGKTYQIVPELTKGNEKGKVVEGETKITYVYEEIKADVIVHYVDEAGNVIKNPVKDTEQASTGTDYDTTDNKPEYIDVDGVRYKLMPKKTIGNETGKLTKEGAEVTYVYHKIVTNWVTEEDRKPLKPQEDGEKEKGSFEGRTFVVTEVDPETGDITHVFKKVPVPHTPTPPVTPAPVTPPAAPVVKSATLPATGEVESSVLTASGLAVITASAGLTVTKRRKEDN